MTQKDSEFMQRAIDLAKKGMQSNAGGPFGAVVVRDNQIIAEGFNRVTSTNDPTAHAEVVAIRNACEKLGTFQLDDCVIYTSCEPCPMCLGAIYWARPKMVFFACDKKDAAKIETPITIIAAGNDIIFPGGKMIKRAKKIFPSLKHTLLLKDSKHVQNKQDNSTISSLILDAN